MSTVTFPGLEAHRAALPADPPVLGGVKAGQLDVAGEADPQQLLPLRIAVDPALLLPQPGVAGDLQGPSRAGS